MSAPTPIKAEIKTEESGDQKSVVDAQSAARPTHEFKVIVPE